MAKEKSPGLLEQERVIFEAVAEIDQLLADQNIEPKLRPLKAAILFVEYFVLEVSGGDKENFADQGWFAIVYHHVKDWYDQTYGAQMHEKSDGIARGVVEVRGLPVALNVPLTRGVVEEEGKTAWLCFPNALEDGETPTDWLVNAPALSRLPRKNREKLESDSAKTAIALRNIRLNTQGLASDSTVLDGLVSGVLPELESAATHILTNKAEGFGLAAWSLQMALERTLKSLAHQQNGNFKETHDLFLLFDQVSNTLASMKRDVMKSFLRKEAVMDARYGQGDPVQKRFVLKSYLAGLEFVAEATGKLDRTVSVSGGRLLLKMPPWLSLPGQDHVD